jgi:hypothetical protein
MKGDSHTILNDRKGTNIKVPLKCLLNKIREHEHPLQFFFRVDKRLQIFGQATEIQLFTPPKQSVSQLLFIADGYFSIQVIEVHPGFCQQENNVKKVASHRPAARKNAQYFLGQQRVFRYDINSGEHVKFI